MKYLLFLILAVLSYAPGASATEATTCTSDTGFCTAPGGAAGTCAASAEGFYCFVAPDATAEVDPSAHSSPDGYVALAPIPGLTQGATATTEGLTTFLNNLYRYMIGIAAVLAVIMIIWHGLSIALNKENVSSIMDSKGRIYNAIFGLVLVLSPYLVFSLINPSILNLSLNLEQLDTGPVPPFRVSNPNTTPYQLSNTELAARQSGGGTVLFAFTLNETLSAQQAVLTLNSKQAECTSNSNGPGIIIRNITGANGDTGYGGFQHYVCQTCPPNTTLTLLPTCSIMTRNCGSCAP